MTFSLLVGYLLINIALPGKPKNRHCYIARTGQQDWCSWSSYKCCNGYGCCGPDSSCCWRLDSEGTMADGCCSKEEQCCSTAASSMCCPINARCCEDSRGKITCCTSTTTIDKILFSFAGVLTVILIILVLYYYICDRHNPKADICKCGRCQIKNRKFKKKKTYIMALEETKKLEDSIDEECEDFQTEEDVTLPLSGNHYTSNEDLELKPS